MKKLVLTLFGLVILTAAAFAGPVGNIITQDDEANLAETPVAFTTEAYGIMKADMDPQVAGFTAYDLENSYFIYEKITYESIKRIKPYVKFGISKFDFELTATGWPASKYEIETEPALAVAGGIYGDIYLFEDTGVKIFGNLEYEYSSAQIDEIKEDSASATLLKDELVYQKVQASLGVSKDITLQNGDFFIPYLGVEYQQYRIDTEFTTATTTADFVAKADDNFNLFAGCNYEFSDTFSLGVEGKFLGENSVTGSVTIRF